MPAFLISGVGERCRLAIVLRRKYLKFKVLALL